MSGAAIQVERDAEEDMKKLRRSIAAVAILFGLLASPALAQTGSAVEDGQGHPNVGALLAALPDGNLVPVCSGTLVAPRVFLTASHCTSLMERIGQAKTAYVTFDPYFGRNAPVKTTPYVGDVITNPAYRAAAYRNDVSLVLLDDPVVGITPAVIAPVGFLDTLREEGKIRSAAFTNVGYGSSEMVVVPKIGPTFPSDGIRKWTISGFHALTRLQIHLNQNLARGFEGTGYGDSGGPTFVETANGPVVVSVVSTGDVPCYATSVNQRVDLADVQAFLAPYLAMR
jgi:secreted trypsin-like serine protease